jgi:hypothetical protein
LSAAEDAAAAHSGGSSQTAGKTVSSGCSKGMQLFWSLLLVVMSVVSLYWYDGWVLLQLLTAWL